MYREKEHPEFIIEARRVTYSRHDELAVSSRWFSIVYKSKKRVLEGRNINERQNIC